MAKSLSRTELQQRIAANPAIVLVEALPEKYFRTGHLPGARHLPHDQIKLLAATTLPDRRAEIITYCANHACQNSHIAANQLLQMGYTNVAIFQGGKQEWLEAGLPLETELASTE